MAKNIAQTNKKIEKKDGAKADKTFAKPKKSSKKGGKWFKSKAHSNQRRKPQTEDYIPKAVLDKVAAENQPLRQTILDYVGQDHYRSMKAQDLAEALAQNKSANDLVVFLQLLRKMEMDYDLVLTSKQKYVLARRVGIYQGEMLAHGKGFGFVRTNEPDMPDIHVSRSNMHSAMHKDTVVVQLNQDPKTIDFTSNFRPEGKVLKINKRANHQIIGLLDVVGRNLVVYPDEKRLTSTVSVAFNQAGDAQPGDKVIVEIINFATDKYSAMGKVVRVLGQEDKPGVDMESVLWQFGIDDDFPADALAEADRAAVKITKADLADRKDMRYQPLITIDGSDAKDLDDAVSCCRLDNNNYQLSVHIADVANYVKLGSALEQEAFNRGTSVYLPDRVMPMLPTALSNGICSLNAGEDRLAMSCTMEITPRGKIAQYEIYQSVIQVDKRFSYDTVNAMLLDQDSEAIADNAEWLPMLEDLEALQKILERRRSRQGAINFNMPETKVIVDYTTGKVIDVRKRVSRLGEKMIEEAMIITNEVVASDFYKRQVPFIYRVHKGPSEEKLRQLSAIIGPLGYGFQFNEDGIKSKDMQKMLLQTEGKPEANFIQTLALRSMSHAFYSAEALGHFGLASKYYSHFTSPIRRYSDLAIHRVIKDWLAGKPRGEVKTKLYQQMEVASAQASAREKVAEEAEREAVAVKCCQFMQDKVGQEYAGRISGVTPHGVFVELENTIEGRIAVEDLPSDQYVYAENAMVLQGKKYKWRLGDQIKIKVVRVDLYAREIDFTLAKSWLQAKNSKA